MNLKKFYIGQKQMSNYLFFIFVLGFTNALYQIAIIKHLSIGSPFYSITLTVNIIVGLTLFSLGLGAYINKFIKPEKIRLIQILTAISIFFVFIFLLALSPELFRASIFSIIYTIVVLSLPMILMGILIIDIYRKFLDSKDNIAKLVFWHTVSFAFGQILAYWFIEFIGANSLFIIILFLFLVFFIKPKIFYILFLLVVILLYWLPIDLQLENFRNKEMALWPNSIGTSHVKSLWSPYVKVDVFSFDDCIAGVYNYGQQWMTCQDRSKDFELRSQLYPQLHGDILLIGAGGGMGLSQFNASDNVTGVELDPVVVELMKGEFSQYNNNAYNQFNVVAADGREFLESTKDKYDYIIYEGIDYTFAAKSKNFIEVENYLYTEEGLNLALNSLKPSGSLILIHTAGLTPVARAIDAVGDKYFVDLRKYSLEKPVPFEGLIVTVSKDIFSFKYLRDIYRANSQIFSTLDFGFSANKITDNKPFLYMDDMASISKFIYLSSLLFILTILGLIFLPLRNKNSKLYFFLLGSGLMISELFFITELRSFFGDYILTFIIFSLIFFVAYSLGNYYFDRFKRLINLTPIVLVWSLILSQFIPWGSGLLVKYLFTFILVAPTAFILGIFFPLALSKIKEEELPFAYMIDSLGVALGFFLFYLISIFFGFINAFVLVLVIYSILIFLIKKIKN